MKQKKFIKDIKDLLEGEVEYSQEVLEKYSEDTSIFKIRPQVIVFPRNTEDVKRLVAYVSQHKELSLTPRSAGTDMTGGPLNTSIIVDMTRYFSSIRELSDSGVVTDPGVYYRDFEKYTPPKSLHHTRKNF